jgi:hypothetical protein
VSLVRRGQASAGLVDIQYTADPSSARYAVATKHGGPSIWWTQHTTGPHTAATVHGGAEQRIEQNRFTAANAFSVGGASRSRLGLKRINDLQERELMKIRIAGTDLPNAMFAHEDCCMRIMQQITGEMR